jgi:hypothetical protein
VREAKLELEFRRYETYEDKIREVYRPKGLLAFAAAAREYVGDTLAAFSFPFICIERQPRCSLHCLRSWGF